MGVVYKARQAALSRLVALKLIRSAEFATPAELVRFQNEAEAVAQLDHPHIVPIYEVGQHRGLRFFSMRLIEGSSLEKRLADYPTDFPATARLVGPRGGGRTPRPPARDPPPRPQAGQHPAGRAGHAPRHGLRPGQADGFGGRPDAIRLSHGDALLHVPRAGPGRERLAHHGHRRVRPGLDPLRPADGPGPVRRHEPGRDPRHGPRQSPRRPLALNRRVPRDLEVICLKCLEKDPERRYPSAQALAQDLTRWLRGEPIHARPVGMATRAAMWCRRHPLPAALAGLLALAVIGGLAGVTWKWREAAQARDELMTINHFLVHKLLDQASPRFNPRGADLKVGELLDRASATVKGEFEGRPDLEASLRRTLGSTYQGLGLYAKADPHFREAITLDSRYRGAADRQTLGDMNLLTALLDEAGRLDEAEPLMRRQLEDCTRAIGPNDRLTLAAEYQLGVLLGHLRRLDEAEDVLRRCVQAQRVSLGPQDEQTLRSINQLGLLLQDRGQLDEAYSLAEEYEHGVKCLWGTKHPDNVTAKASLARVRQRQGQLDVAELLFESAAADADRIFGPEHPRTFAARNDYARILEKNGKSSDAARLLEGVSEAMRR